MGVDNRTCFFREIVAHGDQPCFRLAPLGKDLLQVLGCDDMAFSGLEYDQINRTPTKYTDIHA